MDPLSGSPIRPTYNVAACRNCRKHMVRQLIIIWWLPVLTEHTALAPSHRQAQKIDVVLERFTGFAASGRVQLDFYRRETQTVFVAVHEIIITRVPQLATFYPYHLDDKVYHGP